MIRKILIANRGEIVNRIIRACGKLQIIPVVIYSQADSGLDYLETPVEKYQLKGSTLATTYLDGEQVISIAKLCGADAIHPGYGFLSENAGFARQCEENQLTWIGPSPAVMQKMAEKESSRQLALSAGVLVLPAVSGAPDELMQLARRFNYPLLVKAVSGGGGRGMRIIRDPSQFKNQVELASREAGLSFGDTRVFVEEYLEKAKHIEVQVIGDKFGNLVHLFERECTIQRRYQKLIEESPSPSLSEQQRKKILEDAVNLAKSAGYDSVGTLEFLLDEHGNHFFMEMNARIQVEHPVSEMVTGIDLVAWQIRVADGYRLSFEQKEITSAGHSIECRICAENTNSGFIPAPGEVSLFISPEDEGIRIDNAIGSKFVVSPMFDSLIAKVIIHGSDRQSSIQQMHNALDQLVIHGVVTTRDFIREVIGHQDFIDSHFYTDFIAIHSTAIHAAIENQRKTPPALVFEAALKGITSINKSDNLINRASNPWTALGYWRISSGRVLEYEGEKLRVETGGNIQELNGRINCSMSPDGTAWVSMDGYTYEITEPARTRKPGNGEDGEERESIGRKRGETGENGEKPEIVEEREGKEGGEIRVRGETGQKRVERGIVVYAPLPGILSRLAVKEGDMVVNGDILAIIESMKTENQILAGAGGRIGKISVSEGQQLKLNELILRIENN